MADLGPDRGNLGFALLWAAGTFVEAQFVWAIVALCLLSLASVAYKPFFVATVF